MSKFQVGDIVVGNEKADGYYLITKTGCIMKVLKVYGDEFRGELLSLSPGGRGTIGGRFTVDNVYFDLNESLIQENE